VDGEQEIRLTSIEGVGTLDGEPVLDGQRHRRCCTNRCSRRRSGVSPHVTGSPDRAERNADTMESTLRAVKATAEASA
jgi:hypothetical protein